MEKRYEVKDVEQKWTAKWKEIGTFTFKDGKKIYSIDTPPPFTSGTLHMGHVMDFVWIDIPAKYKRMCGHSVYLPQGFDCHGLPTELKVEREYGISKDERKKFLVACKKWTDKCITKMKEQMSGIGYTPDWNHEYRTMDSDYKRLVQSSLLEFHDKDLLVREKHPIMWCPKCRTALAKAEVGYVEKSGELYYIKLGDVEIATTRPEFLPACIAIVVHPDDKRYKKIVGENVNLPIYDRKVPVITDKEVDMDFGTGAVYLCTYGDEQDIRWQKRYGLKPINIINENGTLNENSGFMDSMNVDEARDAAVSRLKDMGLISKVEHMTHSVLSHVERSTCNSPIELIPMEQWFIKVTKFTKMIKKEAKGLKWYPASAMKRLIDWADSLDWDWIISRQRTFGTPIPFWTCEKCGKVVAAKMEELPVDPRGTTRKCGCGGKAVGEESVCDCWVDSSMTPLKISKYGEKPKFYKKVYPTSMRPQGYEIIRTWAFYTLFRCAIMTGKAPWKDVVIHGMVGGTDGRKMSKSFGNVVEPDEVLEKYGADVIRQWCAGASGADDYSLSWSEMEHSSKFLTKLWNISRFISMHKPTEAKPRYTFADNWIKNELNLLVKTATDSLDRYNYSVIKEIRKFVWHVFADYYIEMVKYRLYGEDIGLKEGAVETCRHVLDTVLRLLAPFVPFIAEEINESLSGGGSIHLKKWPESGSFNKKLGEEGQMLCELLSKARTFKMENRVGQGKEINHAVIHGDTKLLERVREDLVGTARIRNVEFKQGELSFEAKL